MINADAKIIVTRTNYGEVAKWEGGKVAVVYREDLRHVEGRPREGGIIEYARLKLRVVQFDQASTRVFVMLESPHAQLYWLYREKVMEVLKFIYRCERAVNGFLLRPFDQRVTMGFTERVADKIL